jgi:hypothetical protein
MLNFINRAIIIKFKLTKMPPKKKNTHITSTSEPNSESENLTIIAVYCNTFIIKNVLKILT